LSVPGPVPVPVVFEVNVLVLAIAAGESPFRSWPSPPPTSGSPSANCLGVINDAAEFVFIARGVGHDGRGQPVKVGRSLPSAERSGMGTV